MNSTVKDVMSTHVIAVRQGAPYKDMAAMLHDQRVSAFPVIDDDNKVIGVVSETDLLAKEALEGTVPRTLQSLTNQHVRSQVNAVIAADLMTKPAVTIGPDELVTHAARLMFNQRVKRLPVVSGDGTLIGIVTRSDVLSVYSRPTRRYSTRLPRTSSSAPSSATRTGSPSRSRTASSLFTAHRKPLPSATTSSTPSGTPRALSPCVTGSATRTARRTVPVFSPEPPDWLGSGSPGTMLLWPAECRNLAFMCPSSPGPRTAGRDENGGTR